ncbi:homoserine kinase type II [Paenibacillus phyllosphaerae]|uniref:Homoserine kinase type II n=1 Tax=Paenibacillus phyllosphaerae TaxID=274593 RepID=A0A7W5FM14_9BACL|nr:phosphotransferase [Paenibacillus phyllosphaerae]MBB3109514.1 homoserine kinase type II [Paenibacillus phyllosphaerae]
MNLLIVEQLWGVSQPYNAIVLPAEGGRQMYRINCRNDSYTLRFYANDQQLKRVRCEHRMLRSLADSPLSIAVPRPVESVSGESIIWIAEHRRYAVLMKRPPGVQPCLNDTAAQYQSGRGLAELNLLLAALRLSISGERNPGFYELGRFYPGVTDVQSFSYGLPIRRQQQERVVALLAEAMERIASRSYRDLPRQWIHGGCTNGSLLIGTAGRITGLMNFEYCCYDVRGMDLAIALGGGSPARWEQGDGWGGIEAFAGGYLDLLALEAEEVKQLPFLIRLHRLAMLIDGYGRYVEGLYSQASVRRLVDQTLAADGWLRAHGDELIRRLLAMMD